VWAHGQRASLFLREFEILRLFVQAPNRVFTRQQILDVIWNGRKDVDPRTVDVHIRRLRKHLGAEQLSGGPILTIRGVGYKFDDRVLGASLVSEPSTTQHP
jgi:DNA-binding response OmpR family regulator